MKLGEFIETHQFRSTISGSTKSCRGKADSFKTKPTVCTVFFKDNEMRLGEFKETHCFNSFSSYV